MKDTRNVPTLYERLGGKEAIGKVVDVFYEKVLADPRIRGFFEGVDMPRLRRKQRAFFAFAFGAPTRYSGKAMRTAHAPLVARGLTDEHFDAVAEDLALALKELALPPALAREVMEVAASTRADVLGR